MNKHKDQENRWGGGLAVHTHLTAQEVTFATQRNVVDVWISRVVRWELRLVLLGPAVHLFYYLPLLALF